MEENKIKIVKYSKISNFQVIVEYKKYAIGTVRWKFSYNPVRITDW